MTQGKLVRLPFAYAATVILPPRRTPESVILRDVVDVALPTVSDMEAPVALVLHRHDIARKYEELGKTGHHVPVETYRAFGDRLYRPLGAGVSVEDFEADALDAKAWTRGWGRRPGARSPAWAAHGYPLSAKHPRSLAETPPMGLDDWEAFKGDHPKVRRIEDDRETRMAQAVEALARDLLVVDGLVWIGLKDEPHWTVHPDVNSATVGIGIRFTRKEPLSYLFPFAMTQQADAMAFAESLSRLKGWPVTPPEVIAEILRPEAIRESAMVLGAAQMLSHLPFGEERQGWTPAALATMEQLREVARRKDLDAGGAAAALALLGRLEETDELGIAFGDRDSGRPWKWIAYERWLGAREKHPELASSEDLDEDDAAALSMG